MVEGRAGRAGGVVGVRSRGRQGLVVSGSGRGRGGEGAVEWGRRGKVECRWRGAVQDRLDAAVLGLRQAEGRGHGDLACGSCLEGGAVLLGLGGGRGGGGETERAAASRGWGLRRPKLMGGHAGHHVVKYTCKSYSRKPGRGGWGRGQRVETEGEGACPGSKDSERGEGFRVGGEWGGQREARTEPRLHNSAKQVFDKHMEKQTESDHGGPAANQQI